MRKLKNIHPGEILSKEFLFPFGLFHTLYIFIC